MCDKCNLDVSEYKIMHFISAFKCKIALVFTFAHVGLLSSRISFNCLFFTFVDVSFFRLVGLSSWTCIFMSFFLSFYRFFLPSSLVEGKPCLSRPFFVQRHVWRLCVQSALLCSCVPLGGDGLRSEYKMCNFCTAVLYLWLLICWGADKYERMHSFLFCCITAHLTSLCVFQTSHACPWPVLNIDWPASCIIDLCN